MIFKNVIVYSIIFLLFSFLIPIIDGSPDCSPLENPPAYFIGTFNDFGNDTDGDGLYNFYTVEIDIMVNISDNYRITGRFEDSEGKLLFAETTTNLSICTQTVTINFGRNKAYAIRSYRINGPASIDFSIYNDTGICPTDRYYNFTTYNYNYSNYNMHKDGGFTDDFSDYSIDIDNDGVLDYLVIEIGTKIKRQGDFGVDAFLFDTNGEQINFANNSSSLTIGNHKILLRYDRLSVEHSKDNGPYSLNQLVMYNETELIDFILVAYTTSQYNHSTLEQIKASNDNQKETDNKGTPGFEIIFVIFAIALVLIFKQKRKR